MCYENKGVICVSRTIKHRTKDGTLLVNVPDSRGLTPLHVACSDNNVELVRLMMNAGADPEIRYMVHIKS